MVFGKRMQHLVDLIRQFLIAGVCSRDRPRPSCGFDIPALSDLRPVMLMVRNASRAPERGACQPRLHAVYWETRAGSRNRNAGRIGCLDKHHIHDRIIRQLIRTISKPVINLTFATFVCMFLHVSQKLQFIYASGVPTAGHKY